VQKQYHDDAEKKRSGKTPARPPRLRTASESFWTLSIAVFVALAGWTVPVYSQELEGEGMEIVFLHHSTGNLIWQEGVEDWFERYNTEHGTDYHVAEQDFPTNGGNYPYDYWNIWVNHAGNESFMGNPTLELLTQQYDMIILKHCFPVSNIREDKGSPDISSAEKRIENYKLHYRALKTKMRDFPNTTFLVWTGAARVKNITFLERVFSIFTGKSPTEESARRAKTFFNWVRGEWDEPGDNIYLWDFYQLETEGGLYLKPEYAEAPANSHPNKAFSKKVAPLLCQRIVDVIEERGDSSSITGE
jgi:hypothetical protein